MPSVSYSIRNQQLVSHILSLERRRMTVYPWLSMPQHAHQMKFPLAFIGSVTDSQGVVLGSSHGSQGVVLVSSSSSFPSVRAEMRQHIIMYAEIHPCILKNLCQK